MISMVAYLAMATQGESPSPAKLLGTMFSRYYSAKSLVGTIVLTQTVGSESGRIDSELQFERPNKLFIKQQMRTASGTIWIVTCDGKHFSYNKPRDTNSISISTGNRLVESIQTKEGKLDLGGVYAATTKSLGDRSAPLDIAISRKEDLAFLKLQWATLRNSGSTTIDGTTYWKVDGDWREYGEARVSGTFAMLVSEAGDLKSYAIRESLVVNGQTVPMLSHWEVQLSVDATPNQALFKVVL